jgi:hypothetical protein
MQYPETLPLEDHEVVLTFDDRPLSAAVGLAPARPGPIRFAKRGWGRAFASRGRG